MLSALAYEGFIFLGGIVPSSLDAMEARKRDLWSFQEMVCWWGLRLKLIRTRVGRPLLFCKHFSVKYPLYSPFSALTIRYFSFKLKANESVSLNIALPSGKKNNVLQFGSIKNPKGFCFISFLSTQNSSFCIFGVLMSDVPHICWALVELLLMLHIRVLVLCFCLMCCRSKPDT